MQDDELLPQLQQDLNLAGQLLELAEQEFEALSQRDLPRLEQILGQKQPLLAVLAQHGNQRAKLLAGKRLPASRDGLSSLVANRPDKERILTEADALEARLKDCHAANQRNGRIIRANQVAVSHTLGILRGSQDIPDLYDRRGGALRGSSNRPLSQA